MMLFDIKNRIVSFFKIGFFRSLDYQSTTTSEQNSKPEQSLGEIKKLRK